MLSDLNFGLWTWIVTIVIYVIYVSIVRLLGPVVLTMLVLRST